MKKMFDPKLWKLMFLTVFLPMFVAGIGIHIIYSFFSFEEATKMLLQFSVFLNLSIAATLIYVGEKKRKEEKTAKEKETTEQKD